MATALAAMMPPDLHWVHDQEASKYHALPPEDDYLRLLQPKNYMPGQLDAGAACIVGAVQQLVAAQSAAEHCEPIKLFSRDAIWDTPLVIVMRKGHIRVAAWVSGVGQCAWNHARHALQARAHHHHCACAAGACMPPCISRYVDAHGLMLIGSDCMHWCSCSSSSSREH